LKKRSALKMKNAEQAVQFPGWLFYSAQLKGAGPPVNLATLPDGPNR
jgi:hypothetical protein